MRQMRPRFTVFLGVLTALLHTLSLTHPVSKVFQELPLLSRLSMPSAFRKRSDLSLLSDRSIFHHFWNRYGKPWIPAIVNTRAPVGRVVPYPVPLLPPPLAAAPDSSASLSSPPRLRRSSLDWLAQLIQAEAGNQPFLVRLCVGDVVLNRMRAAGFPHHLRQVILQPGQFSSVSNGTFAQAVPTPQTLRAAENALSGWNPVRGDLYYYNPALPHNPWMNTLTSCQRVGAMVFCP